MPSPTSKNLVRIATAQPLDIEDAVEQLQVTVERAGVMLEALRREIESPEHPGKFTALDHLLTVAEEATEELRTGLGVIAQGLARSGATPAGAA